MKQPRITVTSGAELARRYRMRSSDVCMANYSAGVGPEGLW